MQFRLYLIIWLTIFFSLNAVICELVECLCRLAEGLTTLAQAIEVLESCLEVGIVVENRHLGVPRSLDRAIYVVKMARPRGTFLV